MNRKTLFWIVLFTVLAAASAGWYILRGASLTAGDDGEGTVSGGGEKIIAVVYVDGEVYDRIDLSAVDSPYDTTVYSQYGYNTLRVSHGAIRVAESDCDEQVCVNQGAIRDSLLPIVCLPHHLVIEIEE